MLVQVNQIYVKLFLMLLGLIPSLIAFAIPGLFKPLDTNLSESYAKAGAK
jgi:hypothetical protein